MLVLAGSLRHTASMPRSLHTRSEWVFDLDNTLYPPQARLFDQIETRMTAYVMNALGVSRDRANHLRQHYWEAYGTTLSGLMREHNLDPIPYLEDVHDIHLDALEPAPDLHAAIRALPGRKIVYTNGSAPYAERVLAARGLCGLFEAIYGIEHADFHPKPEKHAFDRVFSQAGLTPGHAVMFEDDPRNLAVPHALGLGTVHVAPSPKPLPYIQFFTDDLTGFLQQILD